MGLLSEALRLEGGGIIALTGAGGKTSLLYRLAQELAAAGDTVLTTTTTRIYPPDSGQSRQLVIAESLTALVARATLLLNDHPHLTAAAGLDGNQKKLIGFPPALIDALAGSGLFRWIVVEADGAAGRPLKAPADHEPVIPSSVRWVITLVGLSAIGRPLTERWVHRPERFSALTGLPPGSEITAGGVARLLADPLGPLKGTPEGSRRILFLNQADTPDARAAGQAIAALLQRSAPPILDAVILGRLLPEAAVFACHDLASS